MKMMGELSIINDNVIHSFKKGDERAANLIFDHFYKDLRYYAKKLTGSQEEAEDISLRSFHKLFERCNNFETKTQIKAFLYISTKNICLNYLRAQKLYKQKNSEFARHIRNVVISFHKNEMLDDLIANVSAAIEKLPEQRRKILKMLYWEDLKPAEVAVQLRIAESTVYNQKNMAIGVLRAKLIKD